MGERPLGIDYYSHGLTFFHGPLNLLEYVVIFSTKPTGLFDVRAHIEYEVNDLVLCRISTTLAPWPAEILTVYTIMLVTRCFP